MISTLARPWLLIAAFAVAATLAASGGAEAASWLPFPKSLAQTASPETQCRNAIRRDEAAFGIPASLMGAIALVESGRRMPGGESAAWPWSINAEGVGHVYESKAEAIAAVLSLQATGVQSIDVGCMQVNLMYHKGAFASLDEAFDPVRNADYAAGFLSRLRAQTGSWEQATADYHSATPELGLPYQRKVLSMMSEAASGDMRQADARPFAAMPARPLSASAPWAPRAQAASAAMAFSGVRQAPTFLARSRVQPIPSLAAGSGRSLAAYRGAPIMLNYRTPFPRPVLR